MIIDQFHLRDKNLILKSHRFVKFDQFRRESGRKCGLSGNHGDYQVNLS